ncbi:hypothetical protein OHB54_03125 [Streptomyces sp. NBC_01007]|nr:hypothetical protein OHB54_03125 [Streptomyces sp. NBC_01007]
MNSPSPNGVDAVADTQEQQEDRIGLLEGSGRAFGRTYAGESARFAEELAADEAVKSARHGAVHGAEPTRECLVCAAVDRSEGDHDEG